MLKIAARIFAETSCGAGGAVRMLKGEKLKSTTNRALFTNAVAPTYRQSGSTRIRTSTNHRSVGKENSRQRPAVAALRRMAEAVCHPEGKLDTVFQLAIKECRARTLAHLALPPNESFTVEIRDQ